jgi:hypothetical protein
VHLISDSEFRLDQLDVLICEFDASVKSKATQSKDDILCHSMTPSN